MKYLSLIAVIVFTFLFTAHAYAENRAYVKFEKPSGKNEYQALSIIQSSHAAARVVSLINETFNLPSHLEILIGHGEGPLYDPEYNRIQIPYGFIMDSKAKFAGAGIHGDDSPEDQAMDALTHTLFHEFGHAAISMYDLPVLGKEEDAVDGLATILLFHFFENGRDIAFNAAELFAMESEEKEEITEEDLFDEHSLDARRYYSLLCIIYGSDPERYRGLSADIGFSRERADLCIEELEVMEKSWFTLLEPHMKKSSVSAGPKP